MGKKPQRPKNRARGPSPPGVLIRNTLTGFGILVLVNLAAGPHGAPPSKKKTSVLRKQLGTSSWCWHTKRWLWAIRARLGLTAITLSIWSKRANSELESFIVALYWLCTDAAIAPRWSGRDHLTRVTGFDFRVKAGCLAARHLIGSSWGLASSRTSTRPFLNEGSVLIFQF
jgi:hypothetical protein